MVLSQRTHTVFFRTRGRLSYTERAKGGIGLLLLGDVNIEGGESASISLSKVNYVPKLRDLTDEVHFWGAKIFAHLHYTSADPIYQVWKLMSGDKTDVIPTLG